MTEQAGAQRTDDGTDQDATTSTEVPESQDAATTGDSSGSSDSAGPSDSSGSGRREDTQETQQVRTSEEPSEQPTEQVRTPSEQPTQEVRQEPRPAESAPQGRSDRAPVDVGELVWKTARVLASVVRVVAYVLAAVLVAFIVLTIVGVNPLNAIAQVIGGVADGAVLAFRDLFLLSDPTFAVVVNYGLAAVFWLLVGEFGSRLLRWVGARLA